MFSSGRRQKQEGGGLPGGPANAWLCLEAEPSPGRAPGPCTQLAWGWSAVLMPAARACGVGLSAVQLTGRPCAARAWAVVGPMAANCREKTEGSQRSHRPRGGTWEAVGAGPVGHPVRMMSGIGRDRRGGSTERSLGRGSPCGRGGSRDPHGGRAVQTGAWSQGVRCKWQLHRTGASG